MLRCSRQGRRCNAACSDAICQYIDKRYSSSASSATELAGLAVGIHGRRADGPRGPKHRYEAMIAEGELRQDPRQAETVDELERVYHDLMGARRRRKGAGLTLVDASSVPARGTGVKTGWWRSVMSSLDGSLESTSRDSEFESSSRKDANGPRGLYLYGGPGCGKTMLMDMFASSIPREIKMERVHFHDFMLEVHESLQEHRSTPDPLRKVAKDIAAKSSLICLDELFVNDIADASILHRLFDNLWSRNITLITTSNRHPDALYENGLQRQLFLPFIDMLKARCVIHDMESNRDYRKLAHHTEGLYFTSAFREHELEDRFIELTNKNPIQEVAVDVEMGRQLVIHRTGGCAAYETFSALCEQPLGAADYLALARAKHTLALSGIPKFDEKSKSSAYRFVTLIDILYENRIRLICSAEANPDALFENVQTYNDSTCGKGGNNCRGGAEANVVVDDNLGFVKDRTISRLIEMQSNEYLIDHATRHAPELLKALTSCSSNVKYARYRSA
jgi:protein AFG1